MEVDLALSQIVTQCQVQVRNMPPGTFPPQVLKYDAASVPILQLGLSSKTLKEQEIFDLANNFIRTPLATVQGATVSYPFGGKNRQIVVDLDLDELYAEATVADRCLERAEPAEPDLAGGHREVRRDGVSGAAEQQRAARSTTSTTCRSRRSMAPPST